MDSPRRRSARLEGLSPPAPDRRQSRSLNPYNPRPATSSYSSASTTSYPSPVNDGATTTAPPQLQVNPPYSSVPSESMAHAPLPSPSTADMNPFFARPHSQPANPFAASQQQYQQSQAMQQNQATNPQQMGFAPQRQPNYNPYPQNDGSGATVTAPFLQNFSLVAEAAKRAEMACVMRDFGDVSL